MTNFYTADLHLDHEKVALERGFESAAEHDEVICAKWATTVSKNDTVWVLGDLSIASGRGRLQAVLDRIAELPGRKHLISGNHDKCHPMHRDAHRWQRQYLEVFESVQPFARRKINGENVMLSHFPYVGDHTTEERHQQYRLRDEGLPLLHGHTHQSTWFVPGTVRQVHVGLDSTFLTPIDEELVAKAVGISEFIPRWAKGVDQ